MPNSLLADLILFIHFVYILGVIVPIVLIPFGWNREWKWVRSTIVRGAHLAMIGFVLFEVLVGMACPLTVLENRFLESAGKQSYQDDFIAHWVSKIMYWQMPYWGFIVLYLAMLGLVLALWKTFPPHPRRRGR